MKQISLFFIALLFSISSSAQLSEESFESWTAGQGPANWKILQNNIGTTTQWTQTVAGFNPTPPHTGQHAAYLNSQNVSTGIPEDYLVTPLFNAPVNGQIIFYSRLTQPLDQGSIYKVKILPAGADEDDITAYVELQSWTELEINPQQTEYRKIVVNIPASFENTDVRVAFVILSDNGDRWLIDDVKVASKCADPENLSAINITTTSADLTWDNPSGATKWEIEVQESSSPITGTGVIYEGTLPYPVTNLNPGTPYKFVVKAICADGGTSEVIGAFNFLTVKPGDNCQFPKPITSLPYSNTDTTANYFNPYTGYNGGCGIPTWQNYLNGNDITYAYTATQTGNISINVTGLTDAYAAIFVYNSCSDIGTSCYAGAVNDYVTPAPDLNIPTMSVTAGNTYYIVISSWFAQTIGYTLNIQQELCERPTDLTVTNSTFNGATLNWTSSLSSWEYAIQPVGSGIPTGSGTAANSDSATLTTLTPSTQYESYVRASCGNGTFSSWAGPLKFNTLCGNFTVPYFEGFNSNSTSQFCWTVADVNNDGNKWDMDFAGTPYEGDQLAYFATNGSDNDDMLISPAIVLTGNERLKFRYKTQSAGAVAFKVMASTTGTAPEDFTTELSPLASYGVDEFTEKVINVSNLPAGPVHFAIRVPAGLNGGTELMIDNVIVETMPACAQPTDIVIDNVSITGAHMEWTAGNTETAWEVIVGQPTVIGTPGSNTTGVSVAATNYDATNLLANTEYAAYVRAICSSVSKSAWEGPYYFTTKCDAVAVPFFEGFNSNSTTEGCWTTVNNNGDWALWDLGVLGPFEGDEAAGMYTVNGPNDDWLISPAINLTGNERLKFHYRLGNPNDGNTGFKVLLSTSNADLNDFTEVLVPEATYTNGEYKVKTASLQAYTGPVYIAWQVPPTTESGPYLLIDNVIVEPTPVCPEPMYIEVNNITQTSAQVNWQAGGSETQWELFVNINGEPVPTTGITVNSLPYTLTALPDGSPLQPGTLYQISVKAICNSTTSSISSDSVKFVTLISNDNCETATVIPVNGDPTCTLYASGTLNGATASPQENPCGDWTSADDDVWFEFTAASSTHTIFVKDITAGPYLDYIVYKGDDCDNLIQLGDCYDAHSEFGGGLALLENLTVGAKYKIRIFSAEATTNQTTTFNICVRTPVTPITVNTTDHTVEQLIKDVLFSGDCAQISNITWSTGTNYPDPDNEFGDNPNGIGYFNKNNSGFPFEEGIVMTTGDVLKVPGPNYRGMEQGSAVWLGDTDMDQVMEAMLGAPPLQPSTNASVIEFDFVPSQPVFSFDFMFASEEYGDYIQCFTYDTFAALLTDPNGNTQNIAVIPGTQTPISVFSISGAGYPDFCPGYNLPYFDKYNVFGNNDLSPISFDGQTIAMTATANVQVNQPYHLKIMIAETDNNLDSGVFIKAGINGSGGTVDLGDDLLVSTNTAVCEGQTATIESNLDPATFDFVWKRNDVVIPGETNATLVVSQPGTYTVNANITGYDCIREDSIIVEFYPSIEATTGNPADLTICEPDGFAEFNIASNTAVILEGVTNPSNYTVSYHATADTAEDNTAALTSPYTNTVQFTQTIYVRIQDNTTHCYAIKTFSINAEDNTPEFTITDNFSLCEGANGTITVTPGNFNIQDVTFTWTLNGNALSDTTPSIAANTQGDYVVTINNNGCIATGTVTVTILPAPVADTSLPVTACDSYELPALSQGNTYHTGTNGTGETLPAGYKVTETKLIYIFAQSATTPVCTSETSFMVTITPSPKFTLEGTFTACLAKDITITVNPSNFNTADATYVWKLDGNALTENGSSIKAEAFGIYTVTVSINGCEHTESITAVKDENAIEVVIADNCENNVYTIEATDKDGSFDPDTATYAWEGPEEFTSNKRKFAVLIPGIYNVTVTTVDGCIGEKEFIVTGTTCEIPKGISPNGDHINDELDLSTLDVKKLSIFNRYGEEVYSRNNYKKEWVGQTDKGDQLPTGTYFYMIQLGGENKTGWIYINRQE